MRQLIFSLLFCLRVTDLFAEIPPVKPLSCFQTEADQENIAWATAFSTSFYVVAYRVIPPLLMVWKGYMTPPKDSPVSSAWKAALLAGLNTACETSTSLITATQAASVISFLVPAYWIRETRHSQAQCDYDTSLQNSAATTEPLSCYTANADDGIFKEVVAYAMGLYIGVSLLLPIVIDMIRAAIKTCKATPPALSTSPVNMENGGANPFSDGLNTGKMSTQPYALLDSVQIMGIISYLIPIALWAEKFFSRAQCNYDTAVQLHNNSKT